MWGSIINITSLETWKEAYVHSCSGASHWTELHTLQPASAYDLRVVAVNAIGR